MKEEWCPINGYEGYYEVSNFGRVKRSERLLKSGCLKEERMLSPSKNMSGYLSVSLCVNGDEKRKLVHRLVSEAFIPKINGKNEVNHIDENKENNCVQNLEWCNHIENVNYGTAKARRRKKILSVSLSGQERVFNSVSEAANVLKIKQPCISQVLHFKKRQSHGYHFYFCN
ncbi:MAG: NUMOD4 domain-containing protein [Leuconostoc mesenteroides]